MHLIPVTQAPILLSKIVGHAMRRVFGSHHLASIDRHALRQFRVLQQALERTREFFDIANGDEKSGYFIFNQLLDTRYRSPDNGNTSGESLHHDSRDAFRM